MTDSVKRLSFTDAMRVVRLRAKDLVCWLGFGDRLIEYCGDCGIRQPLVWWSPSDLWERITGHATPTGDNAAGVLCPRCFDRRAESLGLLLQWRPSLHASAYHRTFFVEFSRELLPSLREWSQPVEVRVVADNNSVLRLEVRPAPLTQRAVEPPPLF